MDPDANLAEMLRAARDTLNRSHAGCAPDPGRVARLAELVEALDEWLKRGGALPATWRNG